MFPYTVYSPNPSGIDVPNIPTAWVYTMNVKEDEFRRDHYERYLELWERWGFDRMPEVMYAFNTYQFDDYTKYVSDYFDERDKALYRDQHFGEDCKRAYQIGQNIAERK